MASYDNIIDKGLNLIANADEFFAKENPKDAKLADMFQSFLHFSHNDIKKHLPGGATTMKSYLWRAMLAADSNGYPESAGRSLSSKLMFVWARRAWKKNRISRQECDQIIKKLPDLDVALADSADLVKESKQPSRTRSKRIHDSDDEDQRKMYAKRTPTKHRIVPSDKSISTEEETEEKEGDDASPPGVDDNSAASEEQSIVDVQDYTNDRAPELEEWKSGYAGLTILSKPLAATDETQSSLQYTEVNSLELEALFYGKVTDAYTNIEKQMGVVFKRVNTLLHIYRKDVKPIIEDAERTNTSFEPKWSLSVKNMEIPQGSHRAIVLHHWMADNLSKTRINKKFFKKVKVDPDLCEGLFANITPLELLLCLPSDSLSLMTVQTSTSIVRIATKGNVYSFLAQKIDMLLNSTVAAKHLHEILTVSTLMTAKSLVSRLVFLARLSAFYFLESNVLSSTEACEKFVGFEPDLLIAVKASLSLLTDACVALKRGDKKKLTEYTMKKF